MKRRKNNEHTHDGHNRNRTIEPSNWEKNGHFSQFANDTYESSAARQTTTAKGNTPATANHGHCKKGGCVLDLLLLIKSHLSVTPCVWVCVLFCLCRVRIRNTPVWPVFAPSARLVVCASGMCIVVPEKGEPRNRRNSALHGVQNLWQTAKSLAIGLLNMRCGATVWNAKLN